MADILGTIDETGAVTEWPKTDINGGPYLIPATRVQVTATEFVVIPSGFTQWELVEALKPHAPTPKSKKAVTDGA